MALPGLFEEPDIRLDFALFIIVIGLEVWGLYNLLKVGQFNPIFVVFLFLLDLVFAITRHLPRGLICVLENKLICSDGPVELAQLKSQKFYLNLVTGFFAIMIIGVAAFKILSFYALQDEFNPLTLAIIVSYAIAACIHIWVTGYFIFTVLTMIFFWGDKKAFIRTARNGGVARNQIMAEGMFNFPSPATLSRSSVDVMGTNNSRYRGHHLEPNNNPGAGPNDYRFRTWGLLLDEQLDDLATQQGNSVSVAIVEREGIRHQLTML